MLNEQSSLRSDYRAFSFSGCLRSMARFSKSPAAPKQRVGKEKHPRQQLKKSDRASYFARREAAKVLRTVLEGDSQRRAVGTIKSLVYSPSIRNKKATLALVCQTLKHLPVIKEVLEHANVLSGNRKLQEELIYVVAYDILFGQETSLVGDAEEFLLLQKEKLDSAFRNFLTRKKANTILDLLPDPTHDVEKPVYVRVNTLKLDMESAIKELGKLQKVPLKAPKRLPLERPGMPDCEHFLKTQGCKFGRNCKYNHPRASSVSGLPQRPSEPTCAFYLENGICNYGTICKFHHPVGKVEKDDLVPDLLILPPGTDLHDHPLIKEGNIFLQGKASSMVAVALAPKSGWKVLDACAAPGNKTAHLAALMGRKGRIIACEKDKKRVTRLKETIRLSGASNVYILNEDFLTLNPEDAPYSEVNAILLDPSCSGSGMASARLDHLLPSYAEGHADDEERLTKLSSFQKMALEHALSFPKVERIVYSTCSIHQAENEDVVNSVLPLAASKGFQLEKCFPQWPSRGLPVFKGSENLVRTDPIKDKEGFFIAVFVRKPVMKTIEKQTTDQPKVAEIDSPDVQFENEESSRKRSKPVVKSSHPFQFSTKLSRMLLL